MTVTLSFAPASRARPHAGTALLLAALVSGCAASTTPVTPVASPPVLAPAATAQPVRVDRDLYAQNGPAPRRSLTRRFLDWTGLSEHLPVDANGDIRLLQIGGYQLEIRPSLHDPLTALGACADLVTTCYGPTMSLDQCVAGARVCATQTPWEEDACCPAACRANYEQARHAGTSPTDAFQRVYFLHPDCFPGVTAMVGGQR